LKLPLLIAEAVLIAAVGTLPGNAVAGHAPQILVHAVLADTEAAAALPAEDERLPAALALPGRLLAPTSSACCVGKCTTHCLSCRSILSMVIKQKPLMATGYD
jgi:hypothetical protein